jgi:hypothetical protein
MNLFSEEQVAQLAPDAPSLRAGRELANERKWIACFCSDRALWGEIQGSGSKPYKTQVDRSSGASKCTCPSRKFPCKHGLGLLFLAANHLHAFRVLQDEPEWVSTWLDKRAGQPNTPDSPAVVDEKKERDKAKRQEDRMDLVQTGIAELELLLRDLLRAGFLTIPEKGTGFFLNSARRMVDAKATGLANLVKNFSRLDFSRNHEWHSAALENAVKTWLLLEGFKRQEQLEPSLGEHIRSLIGWSRNKKDVLEDARLERVQDDWLVLGKREELLDDDLSVQRAWLYGCQTGRTALLVEYAPRHVPIQIPVIPGMITTAELVFYPSGFPERALIRVQGASESNMKRAPEWMTSWAEAQQHLALVLSLSPWADEVIQPVGGLTLVSDQQTWFLKDKDGAVVEIVPSFTDNKLWKALALSGGHPLDFFMLRVGNKVLPLGIFHRNEYLIL